MRKTEFIQKYLGNAAYPFCDANREAMYDDLHRVVEYHIKQQLECERMKREFNVETVELDGVKQYPVRREDAFSFKTVKPDTDVVMIKDESCCAYEERVNDSRCWNCGDPPKKGPLPKDFIKLKYMHVPSGNQNSDFSL